LLSSIKLFVVALYQALIEVFRKDICLRSINYYLIDSSCWSTIMQQEVD